MKTKKMLNFLCLFFLFALVSGCSTHIQDTKITNIFFQTNPIYEENLVSLNYLLEQTGEIIEPYLNNSRYSGMEISGTCSEIRELRGQINIFHMVINKNFIFLEPNVYEGFLRININKTNQANATLLIQNLSGQFPPYYTGIFLQTPSQKKLQMVINEVCNYFEKQSANCQEVDVTQGDNGKWYVLCHTKNSNFQNTSINIDESSLEITIIK